MHFGLHVPHIGPFASGPAIVDVARAAEDMGLHSLWTFDHLVTPTAVTSRYPYARDGGYPLSPDNPVFDAVAVLGALAGVTSQIGLGTWVLVATYRHPVVLAKQLASIDAIAGGRLLLGVGAGWMEEEFDAVDIPFAERFARMDEHVALMRNAWSSHPAAFSGRFYSHVEASFLPAPARPDRCIPIVLGGHGDAALRRVARYGDGWAVMPASSADPAENRAAVVDRLDALRRFCDDEGRAFDELLLVGQVLVGDDAMVDVLDGLGVDVCVLAGFEPADSLLERVRAYT